MSARMEPPDVAAAILADLENGNRADAWARLARVAPKARALAVLAEAFAQCDNVPALCAWVRARAES